MKIVYSKGCICKEPLRDGTVVRDSDCPVQHQVTGTHIYELRHGGVVCEIDGRRIPELVTLNISCEVDAPVEIDARIYATTPLDMHFDSPNVRIVHNDAVALDFIRRLSYDGQANCWCEAAIDDPSMQGEHSQLCKDLQEFVKWTKRPTPGGEGDFTGG